jgi:sulfur relay protein TusB/DsrH
MILHTLSAPPESGVAEQCLAALAGEDTLMLLGSGVLNSWRFGATGGDALNIPAPVYALEADIRAHGITLPEGSPVQMIDHAGFVELAVRCKKQVAWF